MKSLRKYIAAILGVVALSLVTANAQSFATPSNNKRTIEDQVRKKILMLPRYEIFDAIKYDVNGDTVTLSGKVRNATNRKDAERSVAKIPGVRQVVNHIDILPVGGFDESIRARLYYTLANSGGLSQYLWTNAPSVRLIVDRGHVTLEGYVARRGDYNSMNILANGVSGVFSVTNNLIVDRERVR